MDNYIKTSQLAETGALYLEHCEKKQKLFGGEKMKLNGDDFWFELLSRDWFKTLFDIPIDIDISKLGLGDDFRDYHVDKISSMNFNIRHAITQLSKESSMVLEKLNEDWDWELNPQMETHVLVLAVEKAISDKDRGRGFKYHLKTLKKEVNMDLDSNSYEISKREEMMRLKEEAEEEAEKVSAKEEEIKERIIEKHGEEIWQSYKEGDLCYDMPIELVRLMKGKEGQKKQSASKSSGTKTQLFYGKKTSKRGTVSYTSRIDFENGLCSGWTDL